MRILVTSDTHYDKHALREALLRQPKAEVVIHLGDGEQEAGELRADFPEKMFLQVRGNCDWGSPLPAEGEIALAGKRVFYTHGHLYGVKQGYYRIVCAAREKKADLLLFGHTHEAFTDYDGGLYIMNPGTLHGAGATYGIVDITGAGIVTNVIAL